ncbi:curli production assembly protein CsgE [Stutzerimonas urumqiensis]|uniref:CsgE family curli-type amyloid fiber assembly protein n=1 Tax=Stutzerimonas urumqiensis TaxID=638269 RepID=UPI003DA35A0D
MPRLILFALLLALTAPARAVEPEISGLVIDNTISRFGHDFHRYLSSSLQDSGELDYNLVVRERPSARWGSLVWVEHEGRILYRRFLQPNASQIGELAEHAAAQVREAITRERLQSLLQDTYDLDRGEL